MKRLLSTTLSQLMMLCCFQAMALPQADCKGHRFRVLFYNTENLFDTYNDPATEDDEFTPSSFRRWDVVKFKQKVNRIGQVIAAAGEWGQVELVGLCEVENDTVLHHLTRYTALKEAGYSHIVTRSPDRRGINVALLYQRETFRLVSDTAYRIERVPGTRDILHATGIIPSGDTLHAMVVHFPSKRGGNRATEGKRAEALIRLSEIIQSIRQNSPSSFIIVMGDFNDEADKMARLSPDPIVFERPFGQTDIQKLYALLPPVRGSEQGSYKYKGAWSRIDQIIVSGSLLKPGAFPRVDEGKATVFAPDFLLSPDPDHKGLYPFRSYQGRRYSGGYSDHLPVFCDLLLMY